MIQVKRLNGFDYMRKAIKSQNIFNLFTIKIINNQEQHANK